MRAVILDRQSLGFEPTPSRVEGPVTSPADRTPLRGLGLLPEQVAGQDDIAAPEHQRNPVVSCAHTGASKPTLLEGIAFRPGPRNGEFVVSDPSGRGPAGRRPGGRQASSHFWSLSGHFCERAPQAGAREGRGPAGCRPGGTRPSRHGPGRLWPWREGRVCGRCGGILAAGGREVHGSVTEVRRRHGDAGNSGLPPVLSNTDLRAVDFDPPIGGPKSTARYRRLDSGPKRASRGRKV
jgi:hypothetical protein